jgi:parallel beta-helix repeat protein
MKTRITSAGFRVFFTLMACLMLATGNQVTAQNLRMGIGSSITPNAYSYPSPYGNSSYSSKQQYLIRAIEFDSAGASGPIWLSSIAFFDSLEAMATHADMSIRLKHTSQNELQYWESGLTEVYNSSAFTDVHGWNTHTFNQPFFYDGQSNVVVEVCYNNSSNKTIGRVLLTDTFSYVVSRVIYDDYYGICGDTSYNENYYVRPDMLFGTTALFSVDAGSPQEDYGFIVMNTSSIPMDVSFTNYGSTTLTAVNLVYQLNGGSPVSTPWVGSLAPGFESAPISLGSVMLPSGFSTIRLWTSSPNGVADLNTSNDTSWVRLFYSSSPLSGVYEIGDSASDFPTFHTAVKALQVAGVGGDVMFEVESGVYEEQIKIPPITGAGPSAQITFRSEVGDRDMVTLQTPGSWTNWTDYNYTLCLDGADYINFESMSIHRTGAEWSNAPSYTRAVELRKGADNNRFADIFFKAPPTYNSGWWDNTLVLLNPYDEYSNTSNPNSENIFEDCLFEYGSAGIMAESYSYEGTGIVIRGNHFASNLNTAIYMREYNHTLIESNLVEHDNSSTWNWFYGIYLDNSSFTRIERNRVYVNNQDYIYGIYTYNMLGSPTEHSTIINNMVSVHAYNSNNAMGIYTERASYLDVFNNSVLTSGQQNYGAAFRDWRSEFTQVHNNIFMSTSQDYAMYVYNPDNGLVSDYNNLYSNGSNFVEFNNGYSNLANYQAATFQDLHSISDSTAFIAGNDLHVDTSHVSSQNVNGAGKAGLVLEDLDYDARGIFPDLGADEFISSGFDGALAWLEPIIPVAGGNHQVKVILQNNRTTPITSAVVSYITFSGSPVQQSFSSLSLAANQSDTLVFTTQFNLSGAVQLRAYINSLNGISDQVQTNDTTPWQPLCPAMQGTYTIDSALATGGANFQNFTAAIEALECGGVIGPVTFNVYPGTYNERLVIHKILGASDVNTITFNGYSGDSTSVKVSYPASDMWIDSNFTLLLDGATHTRWQYITLMRSGSVFDYSTVIELRNRADSNLFTHCHIQAPVHTYNNWSSTALIYFSPNNGGGGGGGSLAAPVGGGVVPSISGPSSYNEFSFNYLQNGGMSVLAENNSNINGYSNQFLNNLFFEPYQYAVYTEEYSEWVFRYNELVKHGNGESFYGFEFENANAGLDFSHNEINVRDVYYGYGLYLYDINSSYDGDLLVSNNMISIIAQYNPLPFYAYYTYDGQVVFNSFRAQSTYNSGGGWYPGTVATLRYSWNIDVRNNLFSLQTGEYLLDLSSGSLTIDYNGYYSPSTSYFANLNGNQISQLASWVSTTGFDKHSFFDTIPYESDTNLHIDDSHPSARTFSSAGYPDNNAIGVDFDFEFRAERPDIGADEYTLSGMDARIEWLSPSGNQSFGSLPVEVVIVNVASAVITSLNLSYTEGGTPVTQSFSSLSIAPGEDDTLVFTTPFVFSSSTALRAYITSVNGMQDDYQLNDTTGWNKLCSPMSGTYTINASLAPSLSNFQSFYEAVEALKCAGISGPVTFMVAAGTYNEKVLIPQVTGMADTSLISFIHDGDSSLCLLTYTPPNTSDYITLRIGSGASNLLFKGISIISNVGIYDPGVAVELADNVWNLTFDNCAMITAPTDWTSDMAGFRASGNGCSNIRISNTRIYGGYYGVYFYYGDYVWIDSCDISNFGYMGLYMYYCSDTRIEANNINSGTTINNSKYLGYFYGAYGKISILNNRLTNLQYGYGIYLYNSYASYLDSGLIANNMISFPTLSSNSQYGLYLNSCEYMNVVHNSILLRSSYSSSMALQLRYVNYSKVYNNILSCVPAGYALYQPYSAYSLLLDYNGYYSGSSTWAYYNYTSITNLPALRTLTGGDNGSIFQAPSFVSDTDLHINNNGATAGFFNNSGTAFSAVSTDIDGQPRNSLTPDMGADEFDLTGMDAAITWLAPVMPVNSGAQMVKVAISNLRPTPITSIGLTYTNGLSTVSEVFSGFTLNHGEVDTFTFSTTYLLDLNATLWAYIDSVNGIADDLQSNDTTTINVICTALSGTYTLNPANPTGSGNFNSFADVIAQLACAGVSGPVIFDIAPGTYTGQLTFTAVNGASAANTITFRSQTGDSSSVIITAQSTASGSNWTLYLNGADYFRFEKISFIATGTSYGRVVFLANTAQYNEFSSCLLRTPVSSSSNFSGFYLNSNSNNTSIRNCNIDYGYYGIYLTSCTGVVLEGNVIDSSQYYGINAYYSGTLEISGNYIRTRTGFTTTAYGIRLDELTGSYQVYNNKVIIGSTGANYGIYAYYCNYSGSSGLIYNNMVSNTVSSSSAKYGIWVYSCNNIEILNNSISMLSTSASNRAISADYGSNVKIRNNAVSQTTGGRAFYSESVTGLVFTHNGLYASSGNLIYWNGVTYTSLSSFQPASGLGAQCFTAQAPFLSQTDLHIDTSHVNAGLFNGGAQPVAFVTDDIDLEARSSTPDIGADEFILNGLDARIDWYAPSYLPVVGNAPVEVIISNLMDSPITSLELSYSDGSITVSESFTGLNITGGTSDTISFVNQFNFQGYTTMRAWIDTVNGVQDEVRMNDTTSWNKVCIPLAGVYTLDPGLPVSSSNFTSWTSLSAALQCAGVSGPVTVNVASGTYNESFDLNAIAGLSAINTLTIQSAALEASLVTLQYSGNSSKYFTVRLTNLEHVKFRYLTVIGLGTSYAYGINLENTDSITIENCIIQVPLSSGSYIMPIYAVAGYNSNLSILNNNILGGYYGSYLSGAAFLRFTGNTVTNWYYFGAYIYNCNDLTISSNLIQNTLTVNNESYGLYIESCSRVLVEKNRILLNSNHSYTNYGMYIYNWPGTNTQRNRIINNFISSSRLSGTDYLIYMYSAYYTDVANNSLYSSSMSTDNRGIYPYYSYYYNVLNNSIYFPNAGIPVYYSNGTLGTTNFNNLSTAGGTTVYYNGNSYGSLSAWQTAQARDLNSISVNPLYISSTDLHSVSDDLDSAATPLVYVLDDIDGEPRHGTYPDIGADEFTPPVDQVDVFPSNLTATVTECYGRDTLWFGIAGIGNDSVTYEASSRFFANIVDDFDPTYDPVLWHSFNSASVNNICGAWSGSNALRFDGGGTRFAQTQALELSNGGVIEFYIRRGTGGSCETPDGGEDLNLEYSLNGGSSWNHLMNYPNYNYSTFTKITQILPAAAQSPNTTLRFVQYSHSGSGYDNWAIDDFSVSTSSPAISLLPDSGTVQSGDTTWVAVALDLTGIDVNDITDFIINVATNDPRNPLFTINVDVNYSGDPIMSILQDSLNFGTVYVGDSDSLILNILNPGCDTLWVSNVISMNPVFLPEQTNFYVLPGEQKLLPVRFTPTISGIQNSILTIYSDAGDSTVVLTGNGEAPPLAILMPDSAMASIQCELTDTAYMWVKNAGLDPLTWSFTNVDVSGGIPFLSAIPKSGSVLPDDSIMVTLYFSRHLGLAGTYRDSIRVITNDPLRPVMMYPVVFQMSENYLPLTLGNDTTVCAGAGVTLNAGPGYASYFWSTAATTQTLFVNSTAIYSVTTTEGNCTYIDSILVTVLPFLSLDAGPDTSHCPGVAVGLLATPTGGSGSFTYLWSPTTGLNNAHIANPLANPSSTVTYTVTVTDAVGCVATDQVVVVTHPTIDAIPSSNSPICYSDSVDLLATAVGGTSPYNYNWSPASNMNDNSLQAPRAKPLSSTYYYVTITDSKGCSDNSWTLVEVKRPYVYATASPSTVCLGDSSLLIATSSSGTAPYSYSWSPVTSLGDPSNDSTFATPSVNTVYTVTVTDNMGCTNTDDITVSVSDLTLGITADDTICEGTSKNLSVSPSHGWPYTYTWSPVAGLSNPAISNPVATPLVETVYYVTVTNAYGCEAIDSVHLWLIPSPSADAGLNDSICYGASTQLSGSGSGGGSTTYTYQWSNYAINNRFIPNPTVDPTSSYTYTLTVTSPNGCTATDQVYIHVYPYINLNAGVNKSILQGDSVTLTASVSGGTSPYQYAWSPNDSINDSTLLQPLVWPDITTQYTLYLTDSKGCTKSDYAWVYVTPVYNLSGTVRYLNANGPALDSVTVIKRNTSTHDTLGTSLTDDFGYFSFPRTPSGWVEVRAFSNEPWNGVNATDALRVRRHIVFLEPLTSVSLNAADVNASSSVSSLDALQILRRTIGDINSFSAGDWAFYEQKDIYMPGNDYTYNLFGLCMGDVNGSNPSPGDRLKPTVHLATQGLLFLNDKTTVDVPIYVDQDMNLGAVTLILDYPEGSIEILGVSSGLKDLMYNDLGGQLRIAWEDVDGRDMNRGSTLLTLKVRLLNPAISALPFSANVLSEFADKRADVYGDVKLFMPALRSGSAEDGLSLSNYPNPFRGETEIVYQIPEDGDVVLEVFNALGERVALLDKQWRPAGTYRASLDAGDLSAGVYSYRLTLRTPDSDRVSTKTMVITK